MKPTKQQTEEFLDHSNRIEGVYDEQALEQANYAWGYLMSEDELTPSVILKTHKILMLHSNLMPHEKGYFRHCDVRVGSQVCMPYREVPDAITVYCSMLKRLKKDKLDTKALHVQFEKIHPFVDGNGRTGRMFMNWMRLKLTKEPLLIIHEGEEQMEYYKWFRE